MVDTTLIVEEHVAPKLDWQFIENQLKDAVAECVALVYVCVDNDWRKDDTWKYKGKRFHQIVLPYDQVVQMDPEEVRQLMLQTAKERLGLDKQTPTLATAETGKQ